MNWRANTDEPQAKSQTKAHRRHKCSVLRAHGGPQRPEKIAAEFVDRGNIDIAMGGGAANLFQPQRRRETRTRDMLLSFVATDHIVRTRPIWKRFQRGAG